MQNKKMKNQKRGIAQTRDFRKEREQTQRRPTLKKKMEKICWPATVPQEISMICLKIKYVR